MATYNFERETRTPQSETFVIEMGGEEIGRVTGRHPAGLAAQPDDVHRPA